MSGNGYGVWWRREWLLAATIAAGLTTLVEAALLQRKYGYFTGGFLSIDHLEGPAEACVFLGGLWIANAGITGPLSAFALWVGGRARLASLARLTFAVGLACLPLLLADLVAYRVLEYLGSAFDFSLMFELAGRSPREIAAVAGAHVARLGIVVLTAVSALGAAVAMLHRWRPQGREPLPPGGEAIRAWAIYGATAVAVALVVSTGLRIWHSSFDNGLRRTPAGDVWGWLVATATDVDGDGFGLFSTPRDPAPFDASVYPWAVDQPGNGLDENGVAGDLPAEYPRYVEGPSVAPRFARRPVVVLIVLESFRADMVGATLNGIEVAPVLNELARRGIASDRAFSHNGYTVQSRFHLLTGSLANLRGQTSLIDDFKANGYEVGYFSGQDETFGGSSLSVGYDRADVFYDARQDRGDRYTTFATPGSLAVPATVVAARVSTFLRERSDRPLFLYVNFHDTHFPYHHHLIEPIVSEEVVPQGQISPRRADAVRRMYMNTVANVDREIGRLLDDVRRSTGSEPAIVVTADHGESLFEEGFLGHGYALNDVQTRVPLIVANLPVSIPEPFVQADLRDVLWAALTGDAVTALIRERSPGQDSLQYLGRIERPSVIRSITSGDSYDFRVGGPSDRQPGSAIPVALIRLWESIQLAAHNAEIAGRQAGGQ